MLRAFVSVPQPRSQRQIAHALLEARGIVRLVELRSAGVTAATVSRMERAGEVIRLARGLYQLPNAPLDAAHSLAEVAKRLPKGIVCLVSALAFHGLTDQLPKKIWLAIGKKDWAPKPDSMPIRVIRFTEVHTGCYRMIRRRRTEGRPTGNTSTPAGKEPPGRFKVNQRRRGFLRPR